VKISTKNRIDSQIFSQCKHKPTLYPQIFSPLTPDLLVDIGGQRYLVDVFVTNSPSNTLFQGGTKDSGERARKIAQRITDKATKYAACGEPLIVIVFLGDHQILAPWNVEHGLYGVALCEFDPSDLYPANFNFDLRIGGCILPAKDEPTPHRELSAVVVCDWFDTLNREAPGKRVKCTVLHHYDPLTSFPSSALAPFLNVSWKAAGDQSWKPCYSGQPEIVARLDIDGIFEYGPYSADEPW